MIELKETSIPGCFELQPRLFQDDRGSLVKTFHEEVFVRHGLQGHWAEEYYSVSHRGVLRGFHFQTPPHDHEKLVYCVAGEVMDVVVDLRRGSPAYGMSAVFRLNAEQANLLYIPRGLAHGFYTLSPSATMVYKVSTIYSPKHDAGILWDSAGVVWPESAPVISRRDAEFPPLAAFDSPFVYQQGGA